MDYRKIILYLIIIMAAVGYWYKAGRDKENLAQSTEKFIAVYSSTAVVAELYRLEPDRFKQARDSIYNIYNFNADSVEAFRQKFEGQEGEWGRIWTVVRTKTDSLISHFKANPVEPMADSTALSEDSTVGGR